MIKIESEGRGCMWWRQRAHLGDDEIGSLVDLAHGCVSSGGEPERAERVLARHAHGAQHGRDGRGLLRVARGPCRRGELISERVEQLSRRDAFEADGEGVRQPLCVVVRSVDARGVGAEG
eukprot:1431243-Pleurochrysis_carterae.AAC.2